MELTAKTSGGLGKVKKVWSAIEDNLSAILLCLAFLFMFYEVLARYFFKSAVYITNEWTPFLTTWSMLIGNAILVRERGHVSIDILKNSFKSEKNKAWLDFYLSLLTLLFSIILAWSSVQFVSNAYARDILSESMLQTPMWIPYSMMIVAGVLMGIHSVVNIIQDGAKLGKLEKWYASLTPVILVAITVVCYILIVKCSTPLITMGVLLLIMLALGLPITMALGLSTIIVIMHFDMISTASISSKLFYSINKNSLLAIPFFVVSGNIMAKGNLGKYLLDWASELLKPMQGGLPIAIILAAMVFAAISGASAASAAALAVIGRAAHLDAVVQVVGPVTVLEPERYERKDVAVGQHDRVGRRMQSRIVHVVFVLFLRTRWEEPLFGSGPDVEIVAAGVVDAVSRGSLLVGEQERAVGEPFDTGITGVDGRERGVVAQERIGSEVHLHGAGLPLRGVRIEVSLRRVQVVDRRYLRIDGPGVAAARTRFGIGVFVSRRLGAGGCRKGQRQQHEVVYVLSKIHIRWN